MDYIGCVKSKTQPTVFCEHSYITWKRASRNAHDVSQVMLHLLPLHHQLNKTLRLAWRLDNKKHFAVTLCTSGHFVNVF